ncbi:MAG: L-threonylcarbamoyladenylate synthase [Rhizomicrobium sp.]|jgi:L-threonylcarbamoyladenylate synthase
MISSSTVVPADAAAIARAADILRDGGLVAFPTETVYGLGADATSDAAVAAIFAAKDRPRFNPLIVHVRDIPFAERLVEFDDHARLLASEFWPGPLTLVLPRKSGSTISLLASGGLDTIAIRVPSHPIAQALLKACELPLAAPSANPSGRISATTGQHVGEEFGDGVAMVLDGGSTPLGLESTVIGFHDKRPVLLRSGALTRERIEIVVGRLHSPGTGKISSPGQLKRHYAPHTPLRLDARDLQPGEALLGFGPHPLPGARIVRNLSTSGDLAEAAAHLFAMLRELDASGCDAIAIMPIPAHGLGEAINDRLRRAATAED